MDFEHKKRKNPYSGVSFARIRTFLFYMYFYYQGMEKQEADACMALIVPMLNSIENRLNPQYDETGEQKITDDTFIQYWIARDSRLSPDSNDRGDGSGRNYVANKLALVDLRFVGAQAEVWAKAFHHLSRREQVAAYMYEICGQAKILEAVGDITPVNVDYFGVGNSTIAFDLTIQIQYSESIELDWKPLELIVIAPGDVTVEGEIEEEDTP